MRRTPIAVLRWTGLAAVAAAVSTACYNFNLTDPNGPTLGSVVNNPSRATISAAATGLFAASRSDIEGFIWRVGSMGREGINLSGNNQPDYSEPYFGPLSNTQFGGSSWGAEYVAIRDANIIIDGAPKAADLSANERALAMAFAQTQKALMFLYVITTRRNLGAPVDVDRAATAPPGPWVNEDGVYASIIATLDSARTNIAAGGSASFPFPMAQGYANFSTPATFEQLIWALEAKALCFRATAQYDTGGGGTAGSAAGYYTAALTALDSSFLVASAGVFANGAYFDFSSAPGDQQNGLSDPLGGATFFADTFNFTDAQTQTGGALDARVTTKIVPATVTQILGGIPIQGTEKFSIYLNNLAVNTTAEIPIIKDEELVLLRAEAEIGTGASGLAVTDLNLVRVGSGHLPGYTGATTVPALTTELIYNRRYSLLWEQGSRWIDARRFNPQFGTLSAIEGGWNPASYPALPPPAVPPRMPIPSPECQARGLGAVCNPLNTPP